MLASAARFWFSGTGTARGRYQIPPHLLVMGAGNSLRPWPGAAQARGQAGGAVAAATDQRRDRALQPPPSVFS